MEPVRQADFMVSVMRGWATGGWGGLGVFIRAMEGYLVLV
jgi:hypothetical protein